MKILQQFDLKGWNLREIKSEPVSEEELAEMRSKTDSYEQLFSRRSSQIKARNIDVKSLQEKDYKDLLLSHYSFLKRPVFVTDDRIFIGNAKKNIADLHEFLGS